MSEHSVTVVRLDSVASADVDAVVVGVQYLLRADGLIVPNDRRDALWQPSAWMPGPRARTAVEAVDWFEAFLDTANNGVEIRSDRDAYHPVENDEAPRCARCAEPAPASYTESYGEWLGRG